MNKLDEQYYTVDEVAQMLRVTRATLYKWMNEGKLSYIQLEGVRRLSKSVLEAFIEERRRGETKGEPDTNKLIPVT